MENKQSYTISFKLDVIKYVEKTFNYKVSLFYQVDQKCFQEWRKQKKEFEIIKNNQNLSIEKVQTLAAVEKPFTTSIIEKKVKELGKALDIQDAKFSASWLPEDIPIVVREFLQTLHVREVSIKTTGNEKLRFTVVLGYTASGEKLPPAVIFKLKKKPKGQISTRHGGNHGTLCKYDSKDIIFVDHHRNHVRDDVIKALKMEGLDVLEIPGRTTCVLQLPDISEKWIDEGKGRFTKKGNLKRALYELEEDNESSNQDDVDNESNPDELDDELYDKSVTDNDSEDMMNIDN
ncbi:23084_t:CDS:2 [Dentiscutata erythropus]|uniref:23084_t:CDS:1 n=1 Tax=Dentiscutata erythropus TaxID=1348616 RepID=A0A9N9B0J0_9GLOM|nr:23084_t:CDS:2 [Dentiscutata erythropus]